MTKAEYLLNQIASIPAALPAALVKMTALVAFVTAIVVLGLSLLLWALLGRGIPFVARKAKKDRAFWSTSTQQFTHSFVGIALGTLFAGVIPFLLSPMSVEADERVESDCDMTTVLCRHRVELSDDLDAICANARLPASRGSSD